MTLAQLLERAARRRPSADAVVDGARRMSYEDLAGQAARLGRGFARLGVARGDRVLIALRNRLEHVLAYWALQMIGGVPAPANFRLAAGEMRYILEDCGAVVVLLEATMRHRAHWRSPRFSHRATWMAAPSATSRRAISR